MDTRLEENMTDTKIGFFGLGLIGGSIAKAIRSHYPNIHIQVYSRRKNPELETGVAEGVINTIHYDMAELFSTSDILFLCAPVLTKTGYANSSRTLLKNSYYLLTPTEQTSKENLDRLASLLSCTQSKCIVLDAGKHDDVTAAISHVPHIVAAALVNMVQNGDDENNYMKTFAAGGFKDITRIASSSPSPKK